MSVDCYFAVKLTVFCYVAVMLTVFCYVAVNTPIIKINKIISLEN